MSIRYNKYKAQGTVLDGIKFDSKKEAKRYSELNLLIKANQIDNLQIQPKFEVVVSDVKICSYFADFSYLDLTTNQFVVEDVKSPATRKNPVYRLKKKLVEALYPFKITEV